MRWSPRSLFARFMLVLVPTFLVVTTAGHHIVVRYDAIGSQAALVARVGNLAARTAAALGRHGASSNPALARDLLAPLGADRAVLCAEARSAGEVVAGYPPGLGCRGQAGPHQLDLPIGEEAETSLRVLFTEAEVVEALDLRWKLSFTVLALAFVVAVASAALGFRFIVDRPLARLLTAIRRSAETGERRKVGGAGRDEIGALIGAFNQMIDREEGREREITIANTALSHARDELKQLNEVLEERIEQRTAELRHAMRRAEDFNRAKSLFLANMSHELRTPLNAIIGFSEIIRDDLLGETLAARYADYANDIHVSARHLLDVISQILDLSKIEHGTFTLNEEVVDPHLLVERSRRLVAERAAAKRIAIDVDLMDAPPALWADRTRLKQVLLNLLSNAIKFTEPGGCVVIAEHPDTDGGLLLVVRDTGIGIAAEDLPRVMDPFVQISAQHGRNGDGAGLGLALCKGIAEAHGGTLVIDSAVGRGTTATLRLPPSRVIDRLATALGAPGEGAAD